MKQLILLLIKCYQRVGSLALVGFSANMACGCRFYPSCSEYARQTTKQYGLTAGFLKTLGRILRCNPLFQGGVDLI